jgi:flagellar hook-basal body complex protein FliE
MKKMEEEKEARAMAEQYPAVADAMGAVREAEQQLKMVVALCRV